MLKWIHNKTKRRKISIALSHCASSVFTYDPADEENNTLLGRNQQMSDTVVSSIITELKQTTELAVTSLELANTGNKLEKWTSFSMALRLRPEVVDLTLRLCNFKHLMRLKTSFRRLKKLTITEEVYCQDHVTGVMMSVKNLVHDTPSLEEVRLSCFSNNIETVIGEEDERSFPLIQCLIASLEKAPHLSLFSCSSDIRMVSKLNLFLQEFCQEVIPTFRQLRDNGVFNINVSLSDFIVRKL